MRKLYKVFKQIIHRDIKSVSGRDYDLYKKDAEEFVAEMRQFIEDQRR